MDDPANVEAAVEEALSVDGHVLLDVLSNRAEISVPGKVKVGQAWGLATSKIKEIALSAGDR